VRRGANMTRVIGARNAVGMSAIIVATVAQSQALASSGVTVTRGRGQRNATGMAFAVSVSRARLGPHNLANTANTPHTTPR